MYAILRRCCKSTHHRDLYFQILTDEGDSIQALERNLKLAASAAPRGDEGRRRFANVALFGASVIIKSRIILTPMKAWKGAFSRDVRNDTPDPYKSPSAAVSFFKASLATRLYTKDKYLSAISENTESEVSHKPTGCM